MPRDLTYERPPTVGCICSLGLAECTCMAACEQPEPERYDAEARSSAKVFWWILGLFVAAWTVAIIVWREL